MIRESNHYKWSVKDTEQFVKDWTETFMAEEKINVLAEKYDCSIGQLSSRASYLRKLGIELPRLYIGINSRRKYLKKINDEMNNILREL